MAAPAPSDPSSPWRRIFEDVRHAVGTQRDENGVLGSINWLRKQMEARGANPNVVRNIIYRDKGKVGDKRVLFEILGQLWEGTGRPPLRAPELEVLLSASPSAEQEVMQLLGREKRRAYRAFVAGVRDGETPRLLVTGRPGSGKTLLFDYVQQALEADPPATARVLRCEFTSADLAASLSRLATLLEVPAELFEAKLVKVGGSGAFAVQADAQADLARTLLDAVRQHHGPLALMLHVSQLLSAQDHLGASPLRLNTPEVPRVTAAEWLWLSLFEPLSRLPDVALMVSMSDVPARALAALGRFEGPVKLSPPTIAEARRFVKGRLPHLSAAQQEAVVQRAGRSFEELRTLTLLAEIREPLPEREAGETSERHLDALSQLALHAGDARLRDFLAAMAVLSIPEAPAFRREALDALRGDALPALSSVELAFLDAVPGADESYRCFSRQLARRLRVRLQEEDGPRYRRFHHLAAEHYRASAEADRQGETAARYLHHLFEAREWEALEGWLRHASVRQSLVRRLWEAAARELEPRGSAAFIPIARQVAAHYVKLGSYEHPDALAAFEALGRSEDPDVRAWTTLKRAEGAVLKGHFERAEGLLQGWIDTRDPVLLAEVALVRASIARWRAELEHAAALVAEEARPHLARIPDHDDNGRLVHAKVAVWAGLIAKDQGRLDRAVEEFAAVPAGDDLIEARVAFQRGDVLMKLGRFDAALREFDRAVGLSRRSEALVQEQSRYLARRGTLRRRRGEAAEAAEDFRAARRALDDAAEPLAGIERAFWLAKLDDERSLALLAEGRHQEAIHALKRNLDTFERYGAAFGVDASYRTMRSVLRLAIAYACRDLGRPYRAPLPIPADHVAGPDGLHAQELFEETIRTLDARGDEAHLGGLLREALLAAARFGRGDEADARAGRALAEAHYPYQRARAQATLAAVALRRDDAEAALERVAAGAAALAESRTGPAGEGGERGDLGLRAELEAAALRALVRLDRVGAAAEALAAALREEALRPYHEALLRVYGEAAERAGGRGWLEHPALRDELGLPLPETSARVRLPDALVARWLEQGAAASDDALAAAR